MMMISRRSAKKWYVEIEPKRHRGFGTNESQTGCESCRPIEWKFPTEETRMTPPRSTLAVVVDVRALKGALIIMDSSNQYVGGVGMEEAGNCIMVLWTEGWWHYCNGTTRIGYICADSTRIRYISNET